MLLRGSLCWGAQQKSIEKTVTGLQTCCISVVGHLLLKMSDCARDTIRYSESKWGQQLGCVATLSYADMLMFGCWFTDAAVCSDAFMFVETMWCISEPVQSNAARVQENLQ